MTARVFLHVGTPKSGTTFLQQVLWSQREALQEQGLLLPGRRFNDHWLACMDVRGKTAGRPRAVGAWQRLVGELDGWDGDALISHELFAGADDDQVARVTRDLESRGLDVHVVVTARDIARQIPAEWQQHLKERKTTLTLPEFVASVRTRGVDSTWFWRVQDVGRLVATWRAHVSGDRVHLVTVPPPGAAPAVLWERFAGVMALEPDPFSLDVPRSNSSVGLEQAELVRRLNLELGERLTRRGAFSVLVKDGIVNDVLAARPGTKLGLTREDWDFAVEHAEGTVRELQALDIDVVGDLRDLVPHGPGPTTDTGPTPDPERVLEEAVAALVATLDSHDRLRVRLEEVLEERAAAGHGPPAPDPDAHPVRRALVAASHRWSWAGRAKRAYKRTLRRSTGHRHG